jgi:hypothetical protein
MTGAAGMMLQRFKVSGRVHTVNDFVVTADLRGQLDRHVSPGWYAVVFFSNGRGIARGATADTPTPAPYILNWMMKVAEALNRQANHGGHWVVAWADRQEAVLLWRDADGDVHVAIDVDAKPSQVESYTPAHLIALGEQGIAEYHTRNSWVDPSQKEIINLAQRAATQRH